MGNLTNRLRNFPLRTAAVLVLLIPSLLTAFVPSSFAVGITITRIDYAGTQLGLEGSGARPNTGILVNNVQLGVSDSTGAFIIQADPFKSYNCQITVTDSVTSAQASLPNCTPTAQPPALLSPPNGAQTFLPLSFSWTSIPGAAGYYIQISQSSSFLNSYPLFTYGPFYNYQSLANGVWYWRVQTYQSPATPGGAYILSDWTPTWSFTIPNAPPSLVTASIIYPIAASGALNAVYVQLSNVAGVGGKSVSLSTTSKDITLSVSFTIPEGYAYYGITFYTGHVLSNTTITVSATVDLNTRSASFLLIPEYLEAFYMFPYYYRTSGSAYGGDNISFDIDLAGTAPAAGAIIGLSSSNPSLISVPSSVTIPSGWSYASVFTTTSIVSVVTPVAISASYKSVTRTFTVFISNATITSFTLNSASVVGGDSLTGGVSIAGPNRPECGWVLMWADQPSIVSVPSPNWVCGSLFMTFFTNPVSAQTTVNISAKFGGVTKSSSVIVKPPPPSFDTVSIISADYDQANQQLTVQATSTNSTATLTVYNFGTGQLIGTLTNQGAGNYGGTFALPAYLFKVKVVSSLGGTATAMVIAR
jgi:hypothetical protein